jgi:hypothetical protein
MKLRLSISLLLLTILALPAIIRAETSIDFFGARGTGDKVTVEWKTGVEQAITKFDVERAPFGSQQFEKVGTVNAKGNYTYYSFVDESGFGKTVKVLTGLYQYRLKIYNLNGSFSYSNTTTVEHSVSSVRRTWGQIKEMFR